MSDRKEYMKKYREENRDRILKQAKEHYKKYYREHRDEILERNEQWRKRNLEKVAASSKEWGRKNKKKVAAYQTVNRKRCLEKLIRKALKLLRGECVICGSRDDLRRHDKKGRKHVYGHSGCLLVLKYPERFALLCESHHQKVHWIMKKTGFSFEKILQYKQFYFGSLKKDGKSLVEVNFDEKTAPSMVSKPKKVSVTGKVDLDNIERVSQEMNNLF